MSKFSWDDLPTVTTIAPTRADKGGSTKKFSWDDHADVEPVKKPESKAAEAGLEGFGEGATLGYLNNIQAATEPLVFKALNAITGKNVESDDYLTARDGYNKRQDKLKESNPVAFGAGQVAGTVVSSIPVAKAAQGATVAARMAGAAKAGAVYGAAQNTYEKEGQLTSLDHELAERTENAGMGAAMGGIAQGAGEIVGATGKQIGKLGSKVGEKLKKTAEQLAENATGATRVQSEKFSDDAGRYLLDNKIVGFADNAENIAEKANQQISKSEKAIDSSLKSLDENGVTVSADSIVEKLQAKIRELAKDASQADVVKKLSSIIDDITNTGESKVAISAAEQTKRGFNKMAKNWQDPEKGQAGKVAYRAYRDAVEEAAEVADKNIASQFKNAKKEFGKLDPIADAAEKRAAQLKQHPIGGLLDIATVAGGAVGSDDPLTGAGLGLTAALARRQLAPRAGASLAVTFDKISKALIKNPEYAKIAATTPDVFRATVHSAMKKLDIENVLPKVASDDKPKKGPEKWANDGADKLLEHDSSFSPEQIEKLKRTAKGQGLLYRAGKLKPGSKEMDKLFGELKEEAY